MYDKMLIFIRGGVMNLKVFIFIGGFYHLLWVIFHIFWPKIFKWKESLSGLDLINRSLMYIQSIFLMITFLIFSFIAFFHTNEMISTNLGLSLIASFALFWLIRSIVQIYFFGYKDKRSIVLIIMFLFGFVIHLIPFMKIITQ
jgi:hypothetical protein